MAGYDPRIGGAFAALGYDTFPFSAFDSAGRPIIPSDAQIPSHYTDAVGRIATAPVWSEIYKAVSVLDDPSWDSYMAGLAFAGNDVRVAIFKSIASVADAAAAHQWSLSYQATVEDTISQYAGASHIVDPAWAKTISEVIGLLPGQAGLMEGSGEGGAVLSSAGSADEVPAGASRVESLAALPWLFFALKAMSSVLTNVTVRTYVRTTVFWYTTGAVDVDLAQAGEWTPLHTSYLVRNRRTVHGIWNATGPNSKRPAIIWGPSPAWRGPSVPDMPHDPWQWCRAFYPTAPCGGPRALLPDGELLMPEEGPRAAAETDPR